MDKSTAAQAPTVTDPFKTVIRIDPDGHCFVDIIVTSDDKPCNTVGPTKSLHTALRWERYMQRKAPSLREALTCKLRTPADTDMVNAQLETFFTHMMYECDIPRGTGDMEQEHKAWMVEHPRMPVSGDRT